MPMRQHVVASLKTHVDREAWQMEYEDALVDFFAMSKSGMRKSVGFPGPKSILWKM